MIKKSGAFILASLLAFGCMACGSGSSVTTSVSDLPRVSIDSTVEFGKNSTVGVAETKSETSTEASVSVETSTETTASTETVNEAQTSTESIDDTNKGDTQVDRSRVFDILSQINIGWNIGNTLDATGGGNTLDAETSWGNPRVTQELIDAVADKGFNAIRVPVTFANHLGPAPDYTINPEWLGRVKDVVDYCVARNLYIILDTHHETNYWLKTEPANQDALCAELAAIWTQLAECFKDYDEKLMFEGMNEPRKVGSAKEWSGGTREERVVINAMNKAFVDAVRATGGNNSDRVLIICGYGTSAERDALNELEIPEDGNIAVAVHMYTPYFFTYIADGSYSNWDGSKKNDITGAVKNVEDALLSKGIPVVVTEMGCQYKENTEDILRWIADYMGVMGEKGMKCFVWDNNIYNGNGEKFGLISRYTRQWYNEAIVDAYVSHAK
ncbi:MAG: glycoside hydrolase family 5 protein [Lachnospiraceae bacterium]|nr:glycoside hydrolase family 5 protein [Lachnospiraceae bacterium]